MLEQLKGLFGAGGKDQPHQMSVFSGFFAPPGETGNCFRLTARTPLISAEEVGGKAHNVIKLFRMGVNVPESCVITCAEYQKGAASKTVSDDVKKSLAAFLNPKAKYAVRSSANVEDGADSAYAGRFSTELNVPGNVDAICAAVLKCWSSMDAPDLAEVLAKANARMGVVVMRQIDSKKSGVLFQANPITGSKATYVITAAYGQGEGVVGGKLAVDTYSLKESTLQIKSKQIAKKEHMLILSETEGIKDAEVPADMQNVQCLTDAEILAVAKAGKKVRQHCVSPQDVEFSFDADGKLYILQTRPITTLAESQLWTAPDVGLWQLNGHLATPMSKFYSPMWQAGHARGGFECADCTGAGVVAMDATDINGFAYFALRNPGPKAAPKSLPPAFFMRNIIRLTGQKSIRVARKFWEEKMWRKFMEEQYPKLKKDWRESIASWKAKLDSVQTLDDDDLAKLLVEAQQWGGFMYGEHAAVTMYNLSPVNWFVMRAMEETGCTPVDGFSCLEGFSDISMGLIGEFPEEIKVIASDEVITKILENPLYSSDPEAAAKMFKELEGRKGESEAFKAVNEIMQTIKYRLVDGYDSANSTMMECPGLIFLGIADAIRKHKDNSLAKTRERGIAAGNDLLARVKSPEAKKELEGLLEEARLVAGLRDERAILTDLTAMGVIHHLLLEAGARLAKRTEDAFTIKVDSRLILLASLEELQKFLQDKGKAAPKEEFWAELAKRKKYREEASIMDAPAFLNGVSLKPSFQHFPDPCMARSVHTIIFAFDQIMGAPDLEDDASGDAAKSIQNDKNVIVGYAGAKGKCQGRARVVHNAQDAASLLPGEICVTQYPSSLVNIILGKAGGIVTDLGGILCHAAICAREAELPCVVGCHTATHRIKTGDLLEVDGTNGMVKILEHHQS